MYPGDFRQYEQAVQRGMASEDQISEQIWSNARVALKKHRNARMPMDCLVATVVVTLVAGLVFFVRVWCEPGAGAWGGDPDAGHPEHRLPRRP